MKTKPLIGITTSFDSKASTMNIRTTYTEAVMHGGGIPVLLPVTMDPDRIRELFESVDGVLLCGGPDIHPNLYGEQIKYYCGHVNHERDVFELELARLCI
ncbi:MAG: gamma-glutamyl-gamma-aminobutyrate hydrolase family protein, partial [Firmicutes bacterium]|nr:gamma-glutamyl-gamma-aminobutyrate hydrolase family protein [Bacillota bacterium]